MGNPLDTSFGSYPATAGAPSSFADNVSASFDRAFHVDAASGFDADVTNAWQETVKKYQVKFKKDPGIDTSERVVGDMIDPIIDPNNERKFAKASRWGGLLTVYGWTPDDTPQNHYKKAVEFNQQLIALNDPDLPSIEQIVEQQKAKRREYITRAEQVEETSGRFSRWVGGTIGGIAGSLTTRDPFNLLTLFGGGGGKTVASRIFSDMVINAGTGAITAIASNPSRRVFGEEEVDPAMAALEGALAGALVRGGLIEPLGALAGKLLPRKTPEPDITPILRQHFESHPTDPSARAGLNLLDEHANFIHANPYPETEAGLRQFNDEFSDIYNSFSRGEAAVARFLPRVDDFSIDNLDFHTEAAKGSRPDLFQGLVTATARLNDLDTQIAELTSQIDNLRVSDAIRRIDEDSGNLVRSFEDDMQNTQLPQAQRERAATQIGQVVSSLGESNVERELNNAGIAPRKQLQSLRVSRQSAKRNFAAARKGFDAEVERLKTAERIKQLAQEGTLSSTSNSFADPTALRADVVEAKSLAMNAAHAEAEAMSQASTWDGGPQKSTATFDPSTRSWKESEPGVPAEKPTTVDLGNGTSIPRDFTLPDPENPERQITAGELADRLSEDDALLDAMTSCSL